MVENLAFEIIGDSGKRNKNGNILWDVKCLACGKLKCLRKDEIKLNKSCGCLKTILQKKKVWKGCGDISGGYWSKLGKQAKKRKLEFTIEIEKIWDLFIKQDRKCAMTGVDLIFPTKTSLHDGNASLDRINSDLGYIEGNVQWVHKIVNFMKQALSKDEFINWCSKVHFYNLK